MSSLKEKFEKTSYDHQSGKKSIQSVSCNINRHKVTHSTNVTTTTTSHQIQSNDNSKISDNNQSVRKQLSLKDRIASYENMGGDVSVIAYDTSPQITPKSPTKGGSSKWNSPTPEGISSTPTSPTKDNNNSEMMMADEGKEPLSPTPPKPGVILEPPQETPATKVFKIASELLSTEKEYVRVLGLIAMVNQL